MITADGYSKDPNIIPEGIAITFGKEMLEELGVKATLRQFNIWLSDPSNAWWHSTRNKPVHEIDHVYVIVLNRPEIAEVSCEGMRYECREQFTR